MEFDMTWYILCVCLIIYKYSSTKDLSYYNNKIYLYILQATIGY